MSKKMTFQPTTSNTNIRQTEVTAKWLQEGTHEGLSASYIRVTQGHGNKGNIKRLRNNQPIKEDQRAVIGLFVESLSTNQVARVTKATIHSELSFMRWYMEIPSGQDKAGEAPHTSQERRPQNNLDR